MKVLVVLAAAGLGLIIGGDIARRSGDKSTSVFGLPWGGLAIAAAAGVAAYAVTR